MTYDRLVCANCASPVTEGRCPVCRASRARMEQDGFLAGLFGPAESGGPNAAALIALLVLLVAAVALLAVRPV
ncbi:hypothetical protein [Streptomyces sp. NPDC060194]|uniref:hypothetical protein n=1 Tax=Streptomyces sp. NPDC060194 TaxID=3347069 RepID=UPI003655093A